MTQRQIVHAPGQLPSCSCGQDPKHIEDLRGVHCGGGNFLECSPCDRRTARYATLDAAVRDFCRIVGRPVPEIPPAARPRALRQVQG